MYTFRQLREAIVAAGTGRDNPLFPFGLDWQPVIQQQVRDGVLYGNLVEDIRQQARRAREQPLPSLSFSRFHLFEKDGNRLIYETDYFERRGRLAGLVFASIIDGTDEHLETLENLIWEICGEYTWSLPAHLPVGLEAAIAHSRPPEQVIDLFAAETAHALAESLFFLRDKLNPWIVYRIKTEIRRRILDPLYYEPQRFLWESVTNNWSAVCAGAVGMAAMLIEEDKERLAGLLDRLIQAMECFMEGYHDDGGCAEGMGYWIYGFGYYFYFADMLESYTNGAIRLLDSEKTGRIAQFPLAVNLSDGAYVNYSDSAERTDLPTGMMERLAQRYGVDSPSLRGIPGLDEDKCYRFAHLSRNLLWSPAELSGVKCGGGEWELENLQWVISRHPSKGSMIAFSCKGGHNNEPHNHNDVGHFVLHAGGHSLLADLGAGVYSRDYFQAKKRYTFLHNASHGHSLLVIDGVEQRAGDDTEAVILDKQIGAGSVQLTLDITKPYPVPALKQLLRSFDWKVDSVAETGRLRLTDQFVFTRAPGKLEEVFISTVEPRIEGGAVRWIATETAGTGAEAAVSVDASLVTVLGSSAALGEVHMAYDADVLTASVEAIATQTHEGYPLMVYRLLLQPLELSETMTFTMDFQVKT